MRRQRRPRRRQALLLGVGIGLRQVFGDGLLHVLGGAEAERTGVADVELDQRVPAGFELARPARQLAADFVTHLAQAFAGGERGGGHGGAWAKPIG